MPEMYLKQPGFTYSACGPFTKNKERIENFMQTGNTNFIYRDELDKACFQHDMAYGKSNNLAKTTQSDKVLRGKAFEIANNRKYDGHQRGLASMVYNFFDKKFSGKPNKIWDDQGSEFYNNFSKDFLKINHIEMYSAYNGGKSVVAERFIRTKCLF